MSSYLHLDNCTLDDSDLLPFVCAGALLSFLCAVGIGANDLSANFAMVVGSGSLPLSSAIKYCAVFELAGAALMGAKVTSTITHGIVSQDLIDAEPQLAIIGMFCATLAATLWLFLSSFTGLPVSITHTVVGAMLGFAVFGGNISDVRLASVARIVASWIVAPVGAAIATAALCIWVRDRVLAPPLEGSLTRSVAGWMGILAGLSLSINACFVLVEQPAVVQGIPFWGQVVGAVVATLVGAKLLQTMWFPRVVAAAEAFTGPFPWHFETLKMMSSRRVEKKISKAARRAGYADISGEEFLTGSGNWDAAVSGGAKQPSFVFDEKNTMRVTSSAPVTPKQGPAAPPALDDDTDGTSDDDVVISSYSQADSAFVGAKKKPTKKTMVPVATKENVKAEAVGVRGTTFVPSSKAVPRRASFRAGGAPSSLDKAEAQDEVCTDEDRAEYLFTVLQLVAGAMSSFVHGAVAGANATGPYIVLYTTFQRMEVLKNAGRHSHAHEHVFWVMLLAMGGVASGMAVLGWRLVKTVGAKLVTVTPIRGYSMQVGGTLVTMICTAVGLPVSLSQCQVGSAIGCGLVNTEDTGEEKDHGHGAPTVNWAMVTKLIAGWVFTIFVAASTTGATLSILGYALCSK